MKRVKDLDALAVAMAVFETATRAEAAKRLGISERTLYNRLQEPEVQAAISTMYSDLITIRAKRLASLEILARSFLQDILQDKGAKDSDRLRAAAIVIQAGADAAKAAQTAATNQCDEIRTAANKSAFDVSFEF